MTIETEAYVLREQTGTTGVLQAARTATAALAHFDIPHLIVGGIAVQEYGYPRVTIDADIVVPDVLEAAELATSDIAGPLQRVSGVQDKLRDVRTGVFIDLLPAGGIVKKGCQVPFPKPSVVSDQLQLVTLEELISLKLDSWINSPLRRLRDETDVVELIIRRRLPRTLKLHQAVLASYLKLWDGIQNEL